MAVGPDSPSAPATPPISEPCASCGVRCCNRFAVPLTGFDLIRILAKLGGKPQDFAHLADAHYIEASPHSAVFIFEKDTLVERILVLNRHPKTNWCHFSRHSNGCAIWGHHPAVCRAYPFILDKNDKIAYTKNCVCPRKWEKKEYDEAGVRKLVEWQNHEIEEYNKQVRAWNAEHARGGSVEEFWRYILKVSLPRTNE